MFDQLAADGDSTSTGGRVYAVRGSFFNEHGKAYATSSDKATCGRCKELFQIVGTARSWGEEGAGLMAKSRDRVLCPCGSNYVLAAGLSNAFYPDAEAPERTRRKPIYGQQFTLKDIDGRPLANVRYRIVTGRGRIIAGTTNRLGETERIATAGTESVRLYTTGGVTNE